MPGQGPECRSPGLSSQPHILSSWGKTEQTQMHLKKKKISKEKPLTNRMPTKGKIKKLWYIPNREWYEAIDWIHLFYWTGDISMNYWQWEKQDTGNVY